MLLSPLRDHVKDAPTVCFLFPHCWLLSVPSALWPACDICLLTSLRPHAEVILCLNCLLLAGNHFPTLPLVHNEPHSIPVPVLSSWVAEGKAHLLWPHLICRGSQRLGVLNLYLWLPAPQKCSEGMKEVALKRVRENRGGRGSR